jgi:mono/diheme cytochrome c family protein
MRLYYSETSLILGITALASLCVFVAVPQSGAVAGASVSVRTAMRMMLLHSTRQAASDLEITGMARDPTANSSGYIAYADLVRLPQIEATIADDPDYPGVTMHVAGVYLETLSRELDESSSFDLMDTLCTDGYRSHFPADYIAAHHPILVLKIDGMLPAAWAAHTNQDDPGPYFVVYQHFVPAFRVLSHADRPQLPTNVVRLNFSTVAETFGAIAPRGRFAVDSPERRGFAIAKQNCLRCHSRGPYGGTKSGLDWDALSTWAREQPAYFASYIHGSRGFEPNARMPGNPEYDAATLAALTAYFRTFTGEAPARKPARAIVQATSNR